VVPTFLTPPRSKSIASRTARALAFLVALIVLCVSLSAEAKKKKHKKGKTPAASSKSKKSSTEAAPSDADESDEGSDEESSSAAKKAPAEEEEAKPSKAAAPESEESPEPAHKPAKAAKPPKEEEASSGGGGLPALQLGLGGKALFRTLTWTDSGGRLAPYSLSPGPEAGLWLEAYPAAFATDGFAANIGLFGRFDYGVGAESKLPNGNKLTTKYQDFYGGLKVRIPLGMAAPYVAGAYGAQKFELTPPDNSRPNFNYSFIRAGAGARLQFTPMVDMDVAANYLIVLGAGSGAGEVKTLYPSSTANGIDATLSFGVRVMSLVGVRAGVDFRQYGVALHWNSSNPGIQAGGATDRYIAAWGGIEIFLDGVGGGAGGGEEEAAKKAPAKAKKAPPPSEDGEEAPAKNTEKDEKASDVE